MPTFLRYTAFGGVRPARAPHLLPGHMAQEAHNVRVKDGRLEPLRAPVQVAAGPAGVVWTLPTYGAAGSPEVFTHPDPETYAVPLYTHLSPGLNHVGLFRKGLPPVRRLPGNVTSALVPQAPTTAPGLLDVTPAGVPAPPDTTGPDARAYVYTWVHEWGVESRPSPPSYAGDTFDGAHWQLTLPPPPPGVLGVRIYRMTYGSSDFDTDPTAAQQTSFHLVTEVDPSVTVWVDTLRQTEMELGEMLRTFDCDPPDMEQVFALENGMLVGWDGNEFYLSEHGEPWNWPSYYKFEVPHTIVGMAVVENTIYLGTTGNPYRVHVQQPESGESSQAIVRVFEYREPAPIESRHQIAASPYGAFLACSFSLVQMGGESLVPVMRQMVPDELWRSQWRPEWLAFHAGRLYGAGTPMGRAWTLDLNHDGDVRMDSLVTLDLDASWLHSGLDGHLYFIDAGGNASIHDAGAPVAYTWVSAKRRSRGVTKFAAAKVGGDFALGPCTVSVVSDAGVYDTHVAFGPETWRLPQASRGSEWWVELRGTATIEEVHVAQSKFDLIQVPQETPQQ